MDMRTPRLATRLTLEAPQRVADGGGGWQVTWNALGNHWAEIRPSSGRERVAGVRESARVTHRITIRAYGEGDDRRPAPDQRFRRGGRIFTIRGVAETGMRGDYLTCWAEEGALP